jgi:hypothetical protein
VARIEGKQTKSRRNPMRQWLGIELAAYVLLSVSLMTAAWTNHLLSGAVVLLAWGFAGSVLVLTLGGIYLKRRQQLHQSSGQRPI